MRLVLPNEGKRGRIRLPNDTAWKTDDGEEFIMYDEIGRDLGGQFKNFPTKKVARWDLAIQALLSERSDIQKPLSVGWLSERTGLSKSYVSNVASGKIKDPPSEKLIKIAEALQISYPELAMRATGEHVGSFFKTGFGQRGFIDYSQHGFTLQTLTPPGTGNRDFFLGMMTVKPLKELKRWQFSRHSMVALYVEQGTLQIIYSGKKQILHANESAYFDGSLPHRLKNIDTCETRLFLVTRPPLH